MAETDFVAWLKQQFGEGHTDLVPIGDDAAVMSWKSRDSCVVTTDLLADGVHFILDETSAERVGRKALAVNLSDLAAMAAQPVGAVVSLLLPRVGAESLAQRLLEGMRPLADELQTRIVGGDTNCWNGPLVINVAAFGYCQFPPLQRSGARPGDQILVTGELGGSRLQKQFDFHPRVAEALFLNEYYTPTAGMDISDGLLLDLTRMATASRCGAVLELDTVPVSDDAVRWVAHSGSPRSPLEHACGDGEDFELLLAMAPENARRLLSDQPLNCRITRIGELVSGPGLWQVTANGRQPLAPRGYDHFMS